MDVLRNNSQLAQLGFELSLANFGEYIDLLQECLKKYNEEFYGKEFHIELGERTIRFKFLRINLAHILGLTNESLFSIKSFFNLPDLELCIEYMVNYKNLMYDYAESNKEAFKKIFTDTSISKMRSFLRIISIDSNPIKFVLEYDKTKVNQTRVEAEFIIVLNTIDEDIVMFGVLPHSKTTGIYVPVTNLYGDESVRFIKNQNFMPVKSISAYDVASNANLFLKEISALENADLMSGICSNLGILVQCDMNYSNAIEELRRLKIENAQLRHALYTVSPDYVLSDTFNRQDIKERKR